MMNLKKNDNTNTVELLKKFKISLQNTQKINQNKKTSHETLIKDSLLASFKVDAIDILIDKGFKINANEYKKLQKEYIKLKKKKLSAEKIRLIKQKYENTLIYLIEIGCLEYLKSFDKKFIDNLIDDFTKIYSRNEIIYDVDTGYSVGHVTSSGKILMLVGSDNIAIGLNELTKKQEKNIPRYKKPHFWS